MASKGIPILILVLRIITLLALVGSVVLLVLDNITLSDGTQTHFQDFHAFRFMLSTAAIGAAYTLLQIPFSIYYVSTNKRLIRSECMPVFDFFGDKLVSLILSAGVGAGFGVGFEFKRFMNLLLPLLAALGGIDDLDEELSKDSHFFNMAIISTGVLLFATVCIYVRHLRAFFHRSKIQQRLLRLII